MPDQRVLFVGNAILLLRGCRSRQFAVAACIYSVVVEALREKHSISKAEVDGQRNNGWDQIRPDSTGKIGNVADHPNKKEGN